MLIKFTVKNFRSFKDEVSLDMNKLLVNSKNNHATNHINKNTVGGFETLKSATIYGANASGKSNLIRAISFLTSWVSGKSNINSKMIFSDDINISDKFLLNEDAVRLQPSCFSIEFNTNKKAYCYKIEILNGLILKESLEEIYLKKDAEVIFLRKYDNGEKNYKSAEIGAQYCKNIDLSQIKSAIIISDGSRPMLQQLLKYNFSAKIKESEFFKDINDAIYWLIFNNVYYEDGETNIEFFELMDGNSDFKSFLLDLIQKYDLGSIYDISNEELSDKEKDNLFSRIPFIKDRISELPISEDVKTAFFGSGQERYLINKKGEATTIKVIKLVRKNNSDQNIAFDFTRESQGTAKLIDLAMFFYKGFNQGKTIIIDEIEGSLHPKIIVDLLDNVLNDEEISDVQFILTTHSECLFDLGILRGDEIWLMNKNNDGSSYLNCLANFKDKNSKNIRYDKKILNDYLLGRYGGIPRI